MSFRQCRILMENIFLKAGLILMKMLTKVEHLIPLKRRRRHLPVSGKRYLMRFDLWMKMELSIAKKQYRTETDIPGTGHHQRQVIPLRDGSWIRNCIRKRTILKCQTEILPLPPSGPSIPTRFPMTAMVQPWECRQRQ